MRKMEEAAVSEIKPNIKKAFILNILVVSGIVVMVIALLIYLNSIVGLDVFMEAFKELGLEVSASLLLAYSIFLILFVTALLLILNYIVLGKSSYTLYRDKMVYTKSLFIIQIRDKAVPYANVTKVSYDKKAFLGTARIILDLTGMKEKQVELDFIDDVEEVVKEIHNLIREYRSRYYAQYAQEYRMQNIMDQ
ncbi:hypothetical protein KY366_04590 [Candidatus Woesearchaeota archaeon]|nr:hypothetical protein [Candidatus Woesearchaeota archaeon]